VRTARYPAEQRSGAHDRNVLGWGRLAIAGGRGLGNLTTADTVVDVAFANDTLIAAERDSGVRFHECPSALFVNGFE